MRFSIDYLQGMLYRIHVFEPGEIAVRDLKEHEFVVRFGEDLHVFLDRDQADELCLALETVLNRLVDKECPENPPAAVAEATAREVDAVPALVNSRSDQVVLADEFADCLASAKTLDRIGKLVDQITDALNAGRLTQGQGVRLAELEKAAADRVRAEPPETKGGPTSEDN